MAEEEKRGIGEQARETIIDVRNELIVQSANLYLLVRKVLLSSLGAVALTMDEANEILTKLVERGEVVEADLQRMIEELRAQRSRREETETANAHHELTPKTTSALEERVETILTRLNVPNKNDIEELSRKISQLNDKVTALNQHRGEKK
ncbi:MULTISPECIES: phasin family protein [Caldilinea]|jgi:poly(hydroxyalkanoate) granule-associated protein|uniref:Poly(Hydroxyalkanoate) granule-associated protein n=1 Tax=Caldilinea aerophila (strain DSM 14535 / JCM 11387 / NBRC 104270 / STL-6-O1) TaxID=926550 RepID=I0I2Q4_CALAS|nr:MULTISPECIES: phasin family protein [Caldilinea]MBO9394501.1 phasin family protein [Caldilinea sp.]BAL99541.1 hypothetical protein CLDAP_15020 [Caldilinea aerophila DSM 14535 = NBRC 104270]GIV73862.1 MAG: poly(hydroxyalkanoate) granule-associated protein [Caldilinea sp.]